MAVSTVRLGNMPSIQILLFLGLILCANSEINEVEEAYLKFFVKLEEIKKSQELLKVKVDMMMDNQRQYVPTEGTQPYDAFEEKQKSRNRTKPVFDARVDPLPLHCQTEELPSNCAKATACTETSGYYNITISRYRNHTFHAFCDYRTKGGDWLHILQRIDGSENFSRPWNDYVEGFGDVDREYWIGLENLYALTNHDGPQELYVYMYDFNGSTRFARYDHFVIGSSEENYQLKSLGKYSGNAGNSMEYSLGAAFSTYDRDRDTHSSNCAEVHKGGWWYKNCARTVPTGFYHLGRYKSDVADGIYWRDWLELWQSMKYFVMMIRRQRIFLD